MRRLVILMSGEVAALAVVLQVRRGVGASWSLSAPPGDVVASCLWLMAVGASLWLIAVTLASVVVEVLPRAPRTLHVTVASVTPRMIRIVVTRAVAVSMISTTAALALAPGVDATVRTGREPTSSTTSTTYTTSTTSTTAPAEARTTGEHTSAAPSARDSGEYRVLPGDNLWTIAAAHLDVATGRPSSDTDIAPYWSRLVETNSPHLISGDPDLIYPGEIVILPEH